MNKGDNPNSLANLAPPFSSTNQPKKPGRKPSKVKKYIKDNNLSADDMSALSKYCLPMTEIELKELTEDPNKPIVIKVFAKALLDDIKNCDVNNLMRISDRAFGKPKESVDIKAEFLTIGVPPSPEDAYSEEENDPENQDT